MRAMLHDMLPLRLTKLLDAFVRGVCARVRSFVMFHSLPRRVTVHCGAPHRVESAILAALVAQTPGAVRVHEPPRTTPVVWIDDDEEGVPGCLPACRLLGRMARLYPSHPGDAMHVDVALEPLHELVHSTEAEDERVRVLVERLLSAHRHVEGVHWLRTDVPCVADVCAHAALEWASGRALLPTLPPTLVAWSQAVAGER